MTRLKLFCRLLFYYFSLVYIRLRYFGFILFQSYIYSFFTESILWITFSVVWVVAVFVSFLLGIAFTFASIAVTALIAWFVNGTGFFILVIWPENETKKLRKEVQEAAQEAARAASYSWPRR